MSGVPRFAARGCISQVAETVNDVIEIALTKRLLAT